jgi:hypothetical protein
MTISRSAVTDTGRTILVFVALTVAAVTLVTISAYWGNDGAEALGYLGGGMFAAALTYVLLQSPRPHHPSSAQTSTALAPRSEAHSSDPRR